MEFLRNIRIKNKIILTVFIVGALSTITGSLVNYFYEVHQSKVQLISNTMLHAKLMSEYCGLPLEFNYPDNAAEVLEKLQTIPDVYDGVLFTLNDSIFASYHKTASVVTKIPAELKSAAYYIEGNYIHVRQPVVYKGKVYGTLYLRSIIDWKGIVTTRLLVMLAIIAIMLVLIFILASVSHQNISKPILRLTEEMNVVANNKDYSVQFEVHRNDEVGVLYAGFNNMLREIKKRENDLKITNDSLVLSESRFRNLVEKIPFPIFLMNKEGVITFRNEKFVHIFGYTESDVTTITEWRNKAYPDESYRSWVVETWTEIVRKANEEKTGTSAIEYRIVCKNGVSRIVEASGITLGDTLLVAFVDLTERKFAEEKLRESEEKLSTLFGAMTEMVVLYELVFDDKGDAVNYRITDCNNAYVEVMGIKKDDLIGELATELSQSETAPYLDEYARVGITGEPYNHTTYFAPIDKHFMISVVSPRRNQFATITTDITAIRQIQEVIAAKNKELENYLYVASHDLRSPLVNIQGFSQRLKRQTDTIGSIVENPLNGDYRASIDKITKEDIPKTINFISLNVTKMDTLINGLLQISRTGRIKMTVKKIDMNQMVRTIIAGLNYQVVEIGAKFTVDTLPDCYGDENQLNQLFSNIIGNAIKYRDRARQLVVEISGHTHYNKVIYSIKDTGIGIAPRHLEKIWDVFYRVDSASPEAGEGIGLSLAKRIADKHKGKIWAESEEGKGSTIHVELQRTEFSE